MEEGDQACTEGDTGVSKSFLSLLFELNQSFFFFLYSYFLLLSSMCCNPRESDSLETAQSLQVPLMAYSDEQPSLASIVCPFIRSVDQEWGRSYTSCLIAFKDKVSRRNGFKVYEH